MSKLIFYGRNINDNPTIAQSALLKEAMRSFGDTAFQITLERKIKKRSNPQNAYYHSCVIPAVLDGLVDCGYPKSELNTEIVHLMLRERFLRVDLVSDHGEVISRIRSTTELSTMDFITFIEDIQRWSAEVLNICIADPNTQSEIALKF